MQRVYRAPTYLILYSPRFNLSRTAVNRYSNIFRAKCGRCFTKGSLPRLFPFKLKFVQREISNRFPSGRRNVREMFRMVFAISNSIEIFCTAAVHSCHFCQLINGIKMYKNDQKSREFVSLLFLNCRLLRGMVGKRFFLKFSSFRQSF